jgi:hypothetical protein
MKPAKVRSANFSDSAIRHLNAYALAAGAAGIGMLAVAPANAEVVYTPTKITISLTGASSYDLNPAGSPVAPFKIYAGFTSPGAYWDTISFNANTNGARFLQGPGTSWSVAPLKAGFIIGNPGRRFGSPRRGLVDTYGPYGGGTYNNHDGFKFGQTSYIGFKFLIGGQIHYGWARVDVRFDQNTPKHRLYMQLSGYAYETIANTSIKAGQTSGTPASPINDAAQPESAAPMQSLGLLALGAGGMPAWRRE